MQRRYPYILIFLLYLMQGTAFAEAQSMGDVDLQDALDPIALSVPPTAKWQPLRVRQAKTPLAVTSQPVMTLDPETKVLTVRLRISSFADKPITLTVLSGLYVADKRGQVYVPLPAQFAIDSSQRDINLTVVPVSPKQIQPSGSQPVGFVGGYNGLLEAAFAHAATLLFQDFPSVFSKMEQINGHWKFRDRAPQKRFQMWLRWVRFNGPPTKPSSAEFPLHFWRLLIWSIFEQYDVQDYASWLRATTSISAEYAIADAAELASGVSFLFDEHGVNASALGPDSFEFYYNQGVRAFRARQLRRAELFFLEAIKKDADQQDAHFNLGLTYYRKKDYESASAAWLVGTGLSNADARVFYHRGVALLRLEKPLKAAKMFRLALAKEPRHTHAQAWLKIADPDNLTKPARKRRNKRRWRR